MAQWLRVFTTLQESPDLIHSVHAEQLTTATYNYRSFDTIFWLFQVHTHVHAHTQFKFKTFLKPGLMVQACNYSHYEG